MARLLEVSGLCKSYKHFALRDVALSLEPGEIRGFIGRNGAGKSTTLKSLLNLVHPDAGHIAFFGTDFAEGEYAIKQRIGFSMGGFDSYMKKKLATITAVTSRFYDEWDDAEYHRYLSEFALTEDKTPSELSAGMQVKYALTLALSHHAELLILDEPTSGLDPVSRDEVLEMFLALQDRGIAILFSTHITSDLEKCADTISYIRAGRIVADDTLEGFLDSYRIVELAREERTPEREAKLIGCKRSKQGFTALMTPQDAEASGLVVHTGDLESIMVHLEHEVEEEREMAGCMDAGTLGVDHALPGDDEGGEAL